MKEYIESGMNFAPLFEKDNSFYIEKSKFLKKLGDGVKTVEFLSLMPGKKLYFIEAKSSAPNPGNGDDFNEFCWELHEKFQHSLDLFVSEKLKVNIDSDDEFPGYFREKFCEYRIIFLLIIKNHKIEWCSDVLDGLQRKLIALRKIWKIEIIVWNREKALEKKFVL